MLACNSETVKHVLRADLALSGAPKCRCWTAEILEAFTGVSRFEQFMQAVRSGIATSVNDFVMDLRSRLCRVWVNLGFVDPRNHKEN